MLSNKDYQKFAATTALRDLATDNAQNKSAIVGAGAISALLQLMGPESSEYVREGAAEALDSLAG
jgi:hypothetical protein